MTREALKLALNYVERNCPALVFEEIQNALAQPEQEPVAYMYPADLKRFETSECFADAFSISVGSPTLGTTVPLYTAPPKRQPLTLDCYDAGLLSDFGGGNVDWWQDYIRAELDRAHDLYQSQAKLKELNT